MSQHQSTNALLAHILAQTRSNIDFLVAQSYIQSHEAEVLTARLTALQAEHAPDAQVTNVAGLGERIGRLGLNGRSVSDANSAVPNRTSYTYGNANGGVRPPSPPKAVMPPSGVRRNVPPPPPPAPMQREPRKVQARALWDYNVDGSDPNDLSFRSGDVIEIIAESNADWWTGRVANSAGSREGLFPSNYVEKLSAPSAAPSAAGTPNIAPVPVPSPEVGWRAPAFPSLGMGNGGPGGPGPAPPYQYHQPPPPPRQQGWNAPPPPQGYYGTEKQDFNPNAGPATPYAQPPPPPPPQEQPEKKKKFGGLGSTMAQSAAGGVGFGAGAAVGSGLINAIF